MKSDSDIKLPPNALESERGFTSCLLRWPVETLRVYRAEIGSDDDFYDLRHRVIFDVALAMEDAGMFIDPVSLADQLTRRGKLDAIGGTQYLNELADLEWSVARAEYHAKLIYDRATLRLNQQAAHRLAESADAYNADPEAYDELVRAELSKLQQRRKTYAKRSLTQAIIQAQEEITRDMQSDGKIIGLETGLCDLDRKTCGLSPGVIVLAARPGMGKTALAVNNIVNHVVLSLHKSALVFSLEMTQASLIKRLLYSRSKTDSNLVRQGKMNEGQQNQMELDSMRLHESKLRIIDRAGVKVTDIRAEATDCHREQGLDLLVIDYLQLVHPSGRQRHSNREREVAEISRGIKEISMELNIPVLLLAQLNREIEKDKGRRPQLSDLRESGAIEQDADMIMFLYALESDIDDKPIIDVGARIAKFRNGQVGTVPLTFFRNFTRFENAAR